MTDVQPKHTHISKLHHMLINIADILMNDEAQVNKQKKLNCESCHVFEYSFKGHTISFVENNKKTADKVIYRDVVYDMPAWNMVVVDEDDNVLFESNDVRPVNRHRVYHCEEKLDFKYWNEPVDSLDTTGMKVIVSPKANEQLNMTRDLTEFLYYETTIDLPEGECTLSIGGTDANAFVAYVDDSFMGADDQHYHTDAWHTMNININSTPGTHKLILLSESLGICNIMNPGQDPTWDSQRLKGICGWIKLCGKDIFNQEWKHYPGLAGEYYEVFTEEGAGKVEWKEGIKNASNLAWYRSTFKTPKDLKRGVEVLLHPEGMGRGQAYINGHNIGRYWMIRDKQGDYTQGYYHIPKDWLNAEGEDNVITLGEMLGASDPQVTICTTEYVSN